MPNLSYIMKLGIFMLLLSLISNCSMFRQKKKDAVKLDRYTLAMVQMQVIGGDLDQNLNRAAEHIARAAANGAKIALLPEMMDLGWTHPSARSLSFAIPDGKTCRFLCEQARKSNIFVCAGIAENDNGTIYNAAVLIDPSGQVLLKHRKLNELDIAHDLYAQGDRLNVAHTELGTIGLHICADAGASDNSLSKSLGYMGADIILSPSSWAVPPGFNNDSTPYGEPWISAYKEVSSIFDLWIIGVSNVGKIKAGPWKDWNCIGNSLAFGPGGMQVKQAPHGANADTIIYVDIHLQERPARGTSWHGYWSKQGIMQKK
jgi:predicted amidohydrolase